MHRVGLQDVGGCQTDPHGSNNRVRERPGKEIIVSRCPMEDAPQEQFIQEGDLFTQESHQCLRNAANVRLISDLPQQPDGSPISIMDSPLELTHDSPVTQRALPATVTDE
jgi:hypothetical protein